MVLLRLTLIAVGAFIAADAVNQWLVGQWRPEMLAPVKESAAPAATQAKKRPAAYPQVARRNIFDSAPSRPVAPVIDAPTSSAPAAPVEAPLNLNALLTGTVVGVSPDQSYAFILDKAKREEQLYRVGDRIMDQAVVTEINRDRVRLVRGGSEQVLRMFEDKTKKSASVRTGRPTRAAVANDDLGEFQIDRNELNEALEDIPRLLTQARLLPNFRAGVTDGFRIFNIVPGSLFAKIGLKNGDVLHRINDVEIKDPTKFMGLFSELRNAPSITLDLVRGKDRKTFEYEIR
jgi:general secretion pathway protein C